jgi:hypothetical protein
MELYELDKLQEDVRCRLAGRVFDLRLLFRDNGLVLQGYAHSYHAKQLAQHFVVQATYIPLVANDIKVI